MQIFEKDWADKSAYQSQSNAALVNEIIFCIFVLAITVWVAI